MNADIRISEAQARYDNLEARLQDQGRELAYLKSAVGHLAEAVETLTTVVLRQVEKEEQDQKEETHGIEVVAVDQDDNKIDWEGQC